jgi:hypothetical protein
MSRYLIEMTHGDEHEACIRSLDAIMKYGSHTMTHSEFGCGDDVHVGWLIVEAESHAEAMQMVPPSERAGARIVELRRWTQDQIRAMLKKLESPASQSETQST